MSNRRPSFEDAVTRLNSKKLDALLETSCLLSCVEFYEGMNSPVFPLLNNEKCRLFSEAIIASSAASYKSTMLARGDLTYVLNGVAEALDDPRISEEIVSGGARDEMLYAMQRFMARMANIQIRQQEIRSSSTIGRLLALLSILPQKHLDQFDPYSQNTVQRFAEEVPRILGASLRDLAMIFMLLRVYYQRVAHGALKFLESLPPSAAPRGTQNDRQAWLIYRLFDLPSPKPYLWFSYESLSSFVGAALLESAFSSFATIFARPIRQIREEARNPVYQIGPPGWRLSPLERYPVVRVDGGQAKDQSQRFIIPNVRTFMRSFGDVVHFALQEKCGNLYNEVRGLAQEVYIRLLIKDRLPSCLVIPEIPYRSPKGEKKGPDCTIVERQSQRLIVVEAKARRVLAETRFTMKEDVFDTNFSPVYDLLLRLQEKVRDLYAGLPEYVAYQAEIDTTRQSPPICVAVVGESVYMMNEIIRYRARTEAEHPLRDYPWVYCVMSMESFELAVEIAAYEGVSLSQVLEEFWDDGATMEPSGHMSDSFRGRAIQKGVSFAESFLRTSDFLESQESAQAPESSQSVPPDAV